MESPENKNTHDALLGGFHSSSEVSYPKKRQKFVPTCYILSSVFFLICGLATVIWTPFQLSMEEKLRMRPGLPAFDWWKNPPDEVMLRTYLYNYTNAEEFLKNNSVQLKIEEIGPIVYMEKLTHPSVVFNENDTMTYVAVRKPVFLPDLNTINLNATITIPNWALLGTAGYLSGHSFFVKLGYNLMIRSLKPKPFVTLTIYQILWNFTDPILVAGNSIVPTLVPTNNLGALARVYSNFTHSVTVKIGTKHGHRDYFTMENYDGTSNLPYFKENCYGGVKGASEGVTYPHYLTKNDTLKYWRKTLCRVAHLTYKKESSKYGINGYQYDLVEEMFNRTKPDTADCFRGEPKLPDGLSDLSKCNFGFPLACSFPHFLYGDQNLRKCVSGLKPNKTRHSSYVLVEPYTGIPMEAVARIQSNLVVAKLEGFNEIVAPFSNKVFPMFWFEYHQVGLPFYIRCLLYFTVNLLPIFQWFLTLFLLALSLLLGYVYVTRKKKERLLKNKVLVFEAQAFISKA